MAVLSASTLAAGAQTGEDLAVDEVRGHAAGAHLSGFFHEGLFQENYQLDPSPQVFLPPEGGGPITDSLAAAILETDLEGDVEIASNLEVSTEGALGPDGFATSSATIENVLQETELGLRADLVDVECRSDIADGPSGYTTVLGGIALDFEDESIEIPESPEPNTVLIDAAFEEQFTNTIERGSLRVVANEQIVDGDDITVIGLHIALEMELIETGPRPASASAQDGVVAETAVFEGDGEYAMASAELAQADGEVVNEMNLEVTVGEVSCGIDAVAAAADEIATTTTTVPGEEEEEEETASQDVAATAAAPRFTG